MREDFESYLLREEYESAREARAARKRRADRQMTQEELQERRHRYSVIVSCVSFLALLALVLLAVLLGEAEATEPANMDSAAQEAVWIPEEAENARIERALIDRATMIPEVTVSHYCVCKECCGKAPSDPAYGITKSGRRAAPYVSVAVDPTVIPLGADVLVDYGDGEIHYYRADDTGSAVSGAHIDLCVSSHQEANNLGIQTATVWWVMPE